MLVHSLRWDELGEDSLRSVSGYDSENTLILAFGDSSLLDETEVLVGGNSSLQLMYLTILYAWQFGLAGASPWTHAAGGRPKFLAPVPGYDRHFKICEEFGIEMIAVPMTGEGPDMDAVEAQRGNTIPRALAQPQADYLRRAGLGAGRERAGAGAEPAGGSAARL